MPQELWHVYQGYWYVQKSYRYHLTSWFGEGSAVLMSHMAYSRYLGDNQYFLKLNIASERAEGWGKNYCNRPLESARAVCEYTQGFLAMKFFITRCGFEIFRNMHTLEGPKDFQERFELGTGEKLASFYSEVNEYLKSLGWGG